MIGGGLALNDIGFILVQATCPMSSLSQSVTLFLSPGARSLLWGYKLEGVRWGVQEVRSDSRPKGRERRELLHALSIWACALLGLRVLEPSRENRNDPCVVCRSRSSCSNRSSPFWREHIPFYRWRGRLYKRECERKEHVCAT